MSAHYNGTKAFFQLQFMLTSLVHQQRLWRTYMHPDFLRFLAFLLILLLIADFMAFYNYIADRK
jgi:hypothetical protein